MSEFQDFMQTGFWMFLSAICMLVSGIGAWIAMELRRLNEKMFHFLERLTNHEIRIEQIEKYK